jgi:hypothetical protein
MLKCNFDGLVKVSKAVTPATAGVQKWLIFLDSRVRGNDENGSFLTFCEFVNFSLIKKVMKMRLYGHKNRRVLALTTLCVVLAGLSGCAMVGPRSISMGRADYNEAINKTENEQMLLSIVKGRYGETFSLLSVSGVVANVRFRTNAGVQAGVGSPASYAGSLVPFSAGLAYEENPTITYAPVRGQRYFRRFLSPITLDMLLLIVRANSNEEQVFTLLVNRINDLQNPDFLDAPFAAPDPGFMRFVELFTGLRKAGVLGLVSDPREEVAFDVVILGYAPKYSQKVREFVALLDLKMPVDESKDIVIPVYFAIKTKQFHGIGITTRSTFDLIEILRAAIEVPQEHARAGLVLNYPPMGLPGQGIRIISSREKPKSMSVAVKYLGYWFYIEKSDQRTKMVFRAMRMFWSLSIAAGADEMAAPILTIPVSR